MADLWWPEEEEEEEEWEPPSLEICNLWEYQISHAWLQIFVISGQSLDQIFLKSKSYVLLIIVATCTLCSKYMIFMMAQIIVILRIFLFLGPFNLMLVQFVKWC